MTEPGVGAPGAELDADLADTLVGPILAGLEDRPLPEHVDAFDAAHRALQDALVALDEA